MAVKVMWARTLRPEGSSAGADRPADPAPAAKPKPIEKPRRRRSSIYDAEGNEVFITLMCLKCHKMRPLSQFGLRRMADGAIRNQPWCRPCRSDASPKKRPASAERAVEAAPIAPDDAAERAADRRLDAGALAAQVAAALHRGRG
jgi:hypothetical protein